MSLSNSTYVVTGIQLLRVFLLISSFEISFFCATNVVDALRKGWNIREDAEFTDLEDAKIVEDINPWCFNDFAPSEITFGEVPLSLPIRGLPFNWVT